MNFIIYDIIFLIAFAILVSVFLYRRKDKINKEGLLLLYKAEWGIKLINFVGKKYKKTLQFFSYVSIVIGYFLMAGIIYFFGKLVYIYVVFPSFVESVKIPPIMPLIPYIDKVVPGLGLPPFYFAYWIIIIAIIAIPHEFFHGIFASFKKIKIKKTGFGFFPFFLPVFLAAFVELDENKMKKEKIFSQMAVLSAGTFANVLTSILFLIVMILFFSSSFTASGVIFDDFIYSAVETQHIQNVNGVLLDNPSYEQVLENIKEGELNEIYVGGKRYVGVKQFLNKGEIAYLYEDLPAINVDLSGAIVEIEGNKISSFDEFSNLVSEYSPGEEIEIITTDGENLEEYKIVLAEHPNDGEKVLLGIAFREADNSGISGRIRGMMASFKDPHIYYQANFEASLFIYNLLWWIVLISISVALINMLPVGIFDGGRFFYLTILALTKNKKIAEKSFKYVTYLFLFLVLLLMVIWFFSLF